MATSESLTLTASVATQLVDRGVNHGIDKLEQLGGAGEELAKRIEQATARVNARFGTINPAADKAVAGVKRSFGDAVKDVQKFGDTLATALQNGGGIGTADAKAAAAAAQERVRAFELIEERTRQAALAQGEYSAEAQRQLSIAQEATNRSRVRAAALAAEAGALERLEIELRQAGVAQGVFDQQQGRAIATTGRNRAAMQQLSFQANDVAVGFAAGTPAMVIFAQQSGQVIQALQLMEGGGNRFLSFLGGPWGLALTTAAVALTPFVAKLLASEKSVGDLTKELQKNAVEAVRTKQAQEAFDNTIEGVTKAIEDNAEALGKLNKVQETAAELALREAQAHAEATVKLREKTAAQLEAAIAAERLRQATPLADPLSPDAALQAQSSSNSRIDALEAQLRTANGALAKDQRNVVGAQAAVTVERAGRSEEDRINREYDGLINSATQLGRLTGKVGKELTDLVDTINKSRDAELKTVRERESAQKRVASARDPGELTNFIAPVSGRPSGHFGEQRGNRRHAGIDIAVPVGTPVKAPAGGVVIEAGNLPGYGNVVFIDHGGGTISRLAHFSKLNVSKGQEVSQGEVVGLSGGAKGAPGSGNSQGPHVHQETRVNGRAVDPRKGRFPTDALAVADRADEALAKVAEDAARRVASFADKSADADRRILDAKLALVTDEAARAEFARAQVQLDAAAFRAGLDEEVRRGDLNAADRDILVAKDGILRATQRQKIDAEEAQRKLAVGYDDQLEQLDAEKAILQIKQGLAATEAERRAIGLRLLAIEQEEERKALERTRDTSNDPQAVQRARNALARLPEKQGLERQAFDQDNLSPLDAYKQRLLSATADIDTALEDIQVRALQDLEDGLLGLIDGTESVGSAFKKMAGSIIADLARIAIQKAILGVASGGLFGFLGFSEGGEVPGFADGGLLRGPGTGTSDSILARVSTGEFIVNAAATGRHLPLLKAINDNRLPAFAAGGLVGAPSFRMPSLRGRNDNAPAAPVVFDLRGAVVTEDLLREMNAISARHASAALAAAPGLARQDMAETAAQRIPT